MEKEHLERYKSLLREAFERDFSDEYINVLISNIHHLGLMEGGWTERRQDEEPGGWTSGHKLDWME